MTDSSNDTSTPDAPPEAVAMGVFLSSIPPQDQVLVADLAKTGVKGSALLNTPSIMLHCASPFCGGIRIFDSNDRMGISVITNKLFRLFVNYRCRHCLISSKMYALAGNLKDAKSGDVRKIGEYPPFGDPTPPKVISLIGPDRDLFLCGHRCENQGMGIGAFTYYRRVVENQWKRILKDIIAAARKLDAGQHNIEALEKLLNERQFTKAVNTVKDAIPQSIRIQGQNPLTLLHKALSQGMHSQNDKECLEIAASVRMVLVGLADRLQQALKEEAELNAAIGRLIRSGSDQS